MKVQLTLKVRHDLTAHIMWDQYSHLVAEISKHGSALSGKKFQWHANIGELVASVYFACLEFLAA